eukprot:scaffold5321_cov202-Skeletonema_menzelii.AAC.3
MQADILLPSLSQRYATIAATALSQTQRAEASSSSLTAPPPKSFINIFIRFITFECGSNDPMSHRYVNVSVSIVVVVVVVAFMNSKIVPSSRSRVWPSTAASSIGICLPPIILQKTSNAADIPKRYSSSRASKTFADKYLSREREKYISTYGGISISKLANAKVTDRSIVRSIQRMLPTDAFSPIVHNIIMYCSIEKAMNAVLTFRIGKLLEVIKLDHTQAR